MIIAFDTVKVQETDNWMNLNIQGKKVLNDEQFDLIRKSL